MPSGPRTTRGPSSWNLLGRRFVHRSKGRCTNRQCPSADTTPNLFSIARVSPLPNAAMSKAITQPLLGRIVLLRRGFAFDEAFEALQLLVEHPVDFGRPLLHAAADVAAEDVARTDGGAPFPRFQRPAERAADALRLQRAEAGPATADTKANGGKPLISIARPRASGGSRHSFEQPVPYGRCHARTRFDAREPAPQILVVLQ